MNAIIKSELDKLSLVELEEVHNEVQRLRFLYGSMKFKGETK